MLDVAPPTAILPSLSCSTSAEVAMAASGLVEIARKFNGSWTISAVTF